MTVPKQNIKIAHLGKAHIIYDEDLVPDVSDVRLFEPERMDSGSPEFQPNTAVGRGEAIFFEYDDLSLVLKHYHRGGFVARWSHDQYLGLSLENTRAFREWRLLNRCQLLGLPAPVPVAARVIRSGLSYRADMIMKKIENTATLADLCLAAEVQGEIWNRVGRCIRRFHDHDIYHADLNARNILLAEKNEVYLVDFDKSCIRTMGDSWKAANMARLHRSLKKFASLNKRFFYSAENWHQLLEGYSG